LYGGNSDYPIVPGMIVLWDTDTPPSGWVICDGTSGTPDMRDFFVEIASAGQESVSAGDNTVAASSTTGNYGHTHNTGDRTNGPVAATVYHSSTIYHNHALTASQSFTPQWYALHFIMKTA
jgi:microcystin-dependent protein